MIRNAAFALAALAAISLGSASSALAMGHGGGHASFGHAMGAGPTASLRNFASPGHHFAFHHRFSRNRFVFVGAPFDYGYGYESCYARVWTTSGWRLVPVCY
jgi:hypothetical protein